MNYEDAPNIAATSDLRPQLLTVPCIARIAGVSASVLDGFGSPDCLAALLQLNQIEQNLVTRRAEAVNALFACLTQGDVGQRRFLLLLKRSCFNGRSIGKHRLKATWVVADHWTDGILSQIAELEDEVTAQSDALRRLYAQERDRERQWLLRHASNGELMRGVALASLSLAESFARIKAGSPSGQRRKQRRLERSFLRYLSRAALKLSPFSTLTQLALATAEVGPATTGPSLRYRTAGRTKRSLVRVKRYLLDQCCALLYRHPGVLANLPIALNNSLETLGEARYRFLRPLHLDDGGADDRDLEYTRPAQVTATLSGPLVPFLIDHLKTPCPHRQLVTALVEEFGQGDRENCRRIKSLLQKLLSMGLLTTESPWPGFDPYLEVNLLSFLEGLPDGDQVANEILETLRKLVHLEEGFAATPTPHTSVRRIDDLVLSLFRAIQTEVDPASSLRLEKEVSRNYYEDVLEIDRDNGGGSLRVDAQALSSVRRAGLLWWRVCSFFEPRYEVHLALEHFLQQQNPNQRRIRFLDLFATARPLWEQYQEHQLHQRSGLFDPFDPFGLSEVEDLCQKRREVYDQLKDSIEIEEEVERIPIDRLKHLLASIPPRFLSPVGPCLFVQPANKKQNLWVLNNIFEGTGRMSARYGAVMPEDMLGHYLAHYLDRSTVEHDGETLELLDMLYTKANTVNAHWPQSHKVLLSPGENSALPADRELRLTNLWIESRDDKGLRLVGADGNQYLPCFMSPLFLPAIPTVLKFLDLFGVNGRALSNFSLGVASEDSHQDVELTLRRQTVGDLVLRRRRWILMRDGLSGLQGDAAMDFAEIQRWATKHRLPREIYLIEKVGKSQLGKEVFKPQYFDLASPLFVELFRDAIVSGDEQMTLTEVLPGRDSFPEDPVIAGPRNCEIMLEWLAFCPSSKHRPDLDHGRSRPREMQNLGVYDA